MKHQGFAVLTPLLLILACSRGLPVAPPEPQCVGDANGNGMDDIVNIMATAVAPGCQVYLPVVAANWRQPWPTPSATLTTEPLILSARIVGELKKIPMSGDLWFSTWASDDNLYASSGDGTGQGYCSRPGYPSLNSAWTEARSGG